MFLKEHIGVKEVWTWVGSKAQTKTNSNRWNLVKERAVVLKGPKYRKKIMRLKPIFLPIERGSTSIFRIWMRLLRRWADLEFTKRKLCVSRQSPWFSGAMFITWWAFMSCSLITSVYGHRRSNGRNVLTWIFAPICPQILPEEFLNIVLRKVRIDP